MSFEGSLPNKALEINKSEDNIVDMEKVKPIPELISEKEKESIELKVKRFEQKETFSVINPRFVEQNKETIEAAKKLLNEADSLDDLIGGDSDKTNEAAKKLLSETESLNKSDSPKTKLGKLVKTLFEKCSTFDFQDEMVVKAIFGEEHIERELAELEKSIGDNIFTALNETNEKDKLRGGDSFLLIKKDNGEILDLIDVAGHGLTSYYCTVFVNKLIKLYEKKVREAGTESLSKVDKLVSEFVDTSRFVTFVRVDVEGIEKPNNERVKRVNIKNFGHTQMLVFVPSKGSDTGGVFYNIEPNLKENDQIKIIDSGGRNTPLGLGLSSDNKGMTIEIPIDSQVISYTDGISEIRADKEVVSHSALFEKIKSDFITDSKGMRFVQFVKKYIENIKGDDDRTMFEVGAKIK